jgi:protein O-mannosyl-transferase
LKLKASAATYSYSSGHSSIKEQGQTASWKSMLFGISLLATLTIAFYWPSLKYEFVFDDINIIKKFYNIRHWGLKQLFFHHARWISFWLSTVCYKFDGFNPFAFRLLNLIFHITTGATLTTLFYLMLTNLKSKSFFKEYATEIALLFGALFLLHPAQTQTVTYVVQGQLEGLAALFVSSILLCYFVAQQSIGLKKTILISLTFLLSIISTGTKEIAIVSPILIALIDWFFIAQGDRKDFGKRIPLMLALALTTFGFYIWLLKPAFLFKAIGLKIGAKNNLGNTLTSKTSSVITPMHFFISQFKVTLHYLFIYLWPFGIAGDYDWKLVDSFFSLDCIVPLAAIVSMIGYSAYRLKQNSTDLIAFGLIWFLICNAPRSTIIASPELVADYKAYLPAIGWLFVISAGLIYLITQITKTKRNIIFATFSIATILAYGTYARNLVWSSTISFWQDIVNKGPNKARSLNNLGTELNNAERWQEAIPLFEKAIQLEPNYWDPYNNAAGAYAVTGKLDKAIAMGEQAVRLNPHNSEAYSNLGSFHLFKGNLERSEQLLNTAIQISPNYGKAHYNLGRLRLEQKNLEGAWLHFKKACREADLDNDLTAIMPYAGLSVELGKWSDAIYGIKKILALQPNHPDAMEHHFNLGNCYAQKSDYPNAINIFKKHIQKYPKDYRARCNLVELYSVTGETSLAKETLKIAEKLGGYPGIETHKSKLNL